MDKLSNLIEDYQKTRDQTEALCKELLIEDYVIQGMEDVSPPKWHLAHTSWFFDDLILKKYTTHRSPHPVYSYIFNSYYLGLGTVYPRSRRGVLSRPSVQEVYDYRKEVDERILDLLHRAKTDLDPIQSLVLLGINHEEQHQELLLMDIKYNFFLDPSFPVYKASFDEAPHQPLLKQAFFDMEGGLTTMGHQGDGFCFDNECPKHQTFIQAFSIANTLVTNLDFLAFIEDGAYKNPKLWLADGWDWLQVNQINAPLYWLHQDGKWLHFTLSGLKPVIGEHSLCHVSFYEADAFARWKGCRLPTEAEWEYALRTRLAKKKHLNVGELWEWTSSAYLPYPGFKPSKGDIEEYNAKFMNNQRVLRGGSFATPHQPIRLSYRNYFGPDKRWPFCGIRLANAYQERPCC